MFLMALLPAPTAAELRSRACPQGLHGTTEDHVPAALRPRFQPLVSFSETVYPPSHPYVFRPLKETVPVFEGRVRLTRDITIAEGKETADLLRSADPTLTIRGSLVHQVCSDRVCYSPRSLPMSWMLKVRPLERERPPESLQRKRH
jgi:hypothetical protein